MIKNSIRGVIYGQLIGDALGTRYEFKKSSVVSNMIRKDLDKNGFLPIKGGGPFNLIPGQVTDDSELAMGMMYSILENGRYDREKVALKYIKWINSLPFDVGYTTQKAFSRARNYNDICTNSQGNSSSLSNGCLMRVSPLAIYGLTIPDNVLFKYCEEDCKMTNPNPITIDAVRVYCIAIKLATQNKNKEYIFNKSLSHAQTPIVRKILQDSLNSAEPVQLTDGSFCRCDSHSQGYFGIALQNAFYELMRGESFYNSLVNIISRGGDTDTNGCIAGSLLGAYYGADKIPIQWKNSVNMENPRSNTYKEITQINIDFYVNLFMDKFFK